MSRRGSVEAKVLGLVCVAIAGLTVYGFASRSWLPAVATEHGSGIDGMIHYLLVATGVIFVLGHVVLGWFVWRFRADKKSLYAPESRKAEWIWTLVPVLSMALIAEFGVLILGLPVWGKVYGPVPENAVVVEIVGKQFEWMVRYPGKDGKFGKVSPKFVHPQDNPLGLDEDDPQAADDIVVAGMVLPAGRSVAVRVRSHDVLHSFTVPEFRIKQDAVPGYTATVQFVPNRPGTYEVACAEVCGLGHYKMRTTAQVLAAGEFEAWLGKQTGFFE
jgi:cytochrome c oxidase subunit 2